ncbi:LEAF RUST 10 DISEASE-RESISTANCE LOCUS RECEPTOR-LIKE PROTEIN KINASE-like 2.8 [Impatiens glandulifera]|uniref:LEAF RUST 10 DISEASE-RESISTANCE LOCUS RECEPTOR-LIKE PROTEIN KINASE-like 2.8 n=1 Tax=Impatiens glandulifera TaxID=253017 RepID=UPI001FB0FB33|nr:LEAF RUST 10 DISEASE-RESISTANCE LOCUS RECEPTOR-LIKE PROTEIN KINASE-like 2.8 [Impatiens glandulifera]
MALLLLFLQLNFIILISASNDIHPYQRFIVCKRLYTCGSLRGIGYPFWGGERPSFCGRKGFQLDCIDGHYTKIITFGDANDKRVFRVLDIIKGTNKMRLSPDGLWENACPVSFKNVTLAQSGDVSKNVIYVALSSSVSEINVYYGCSQWVARKHSQRSFTCLGKGGVRTEAFYADIASSSGIAECKVWINVPIEKSALLRLWRLDLTLPEALRKGFEVLYYRDMTLCSLCEASGGSCGSMDDVDSFQCYCSNGSSNLSCEGKRKSRIKLIIIGIKPNRTSNAGCSFAAVMAILLSGIVTLYIKWDYRLPQTNKIWRFNKCDKDLEILLKDYKSFAPRRFIYAEIKKMTDSFRHELGRGGFGIVYKGKLPEDDIQVAVKILKESKANGEDFINEVKSIGKTSHVNIVKLLGFCLDGSKQALVYEFMPNGSLEKFIDSDNSENLQIGWEKLYQISIGIARGLEYLHRGCNTRILHFDIKPHNILLDEDFCPKISDFGLAKQCNKKQSFISMVDPRGTIGYIAPEIVSRLIGGVSHKSDVYSYGIMVLEIVGGKKENVGAENSSEIYFPHCVYKQLEQDHLGLKDVMTDEEEVMVRKMMTVGLWCIQTNPSQRPSMGKVLQMLEGPIESLENPPKLHRKMYVPKNPANSSSESVLLSSFGINDTL